MFRKRNNNNNRKQVNDETVIVNDFRMRATYGTYRSREYTIPDWFFHLKPVIKEILLELAQKGALDEGTTDVLNPQIQNWVNEVKAVLQKQRTKHRDQNADLNNRIVADHEAMKEAEDICEEKLKKSKERTKLLMYLYNCYEGREVKFNDEIQ